MDFERIKFFVRFVNSRYSFILKAPVHLDRLVRIGHRLYAREFGTLPEGHMYIPRVSKNTWRSVNFRQFSSVA